MNNKDILSSVFSTLRLNSNFYFTAELTGQYAIALPDEKRHIRFHLVRQGQIWLTMPSGRQEQLQEGDIAIVPNGAAQILSSDPDLTPTPLSAIITPETLATGVLHYGNEGRLSQVLCGFFQFDETIDHPVLMNLPDIIVIRNRDLGAEPWIAATLRLALMEAALNEQGMSGVLSRLLEILFIQIIRRTVTPQSGLDTSLNGFMAALADGALSTALSKIHDNPGHAWTITTLAAEAGMSRARFAERFARTVGMPPIEYLTCWRLLIARQLLSRSNLDMAEIAERCGYASVPSFSSRFKKSFNIGPGAYRRTHRSKQVDL